ncbi:hypothetical protein [Nocardia brasiliensis]|uniref:hypothetical protein n=1 Tax=Nocardia brasiliensis TaxID=37326 RepID=UPI00366C5B00
MLLLKIHRFGGWTLRLPWFRYCRRGLGWCVVAFVAPALAVGASGGPAAAEPQSDGAELTATVRMPKGESGPRALSVHAKCTGTQDPSADTLIDVSYTTANDAPLVVQPYAKQGNTTPSHGTEPYSAWNSESTEDKDFAGLPAGIDPATIVVRLVCHLEGGPVTTEQTPKVVKGSEGGKSIPKKTKPDPPSAPFTITSVSADKCAVVRGDNTVGLAECQPDNKRQQWRYVHKTVEGFGSNLLQNVDTQRCVTFPPLGRDFEVKASGECAAGSARDWFDFRGTGDSAAIATSYKVVSSEYEKHDGTKVTNYTHEVCWYASADNVRAAGCGLQLGDIALSPEYQWKKKPV